MKTSFLAVVFLSIVTAKLVNSKGHGKIALNSTEVRKSFFIDSVVTHSGEFECFSPSINGTRTVLRFDIVINNFSNESAVFYPYTVPLQLHYTVYDLTAGSMAITGYLNISCIRDTYCYGLDEGNSNEMTPFFYACVHSGISKGCQQIASGKGDCRWIDVTELDFLHVYQITMWLVKPDLLNTTRGQVDPSAWTMTVSLKNIERNKAPSTLRILGSVGLFGGIQVVAVVFSACYIHKHRAELEEHYLLQEQEDSKSD